MKKVLSVVTVFLFVITMLILLKAPRIETYGAEFEMKGDKIRRITKKGEDYCYLISGIGPDFKKIYEKNGYRYIGDNSLIQENKKYSFYEVYYSHENYSHAFIRESDGFISVISVKDNRLSDVDIFASEIFDLIINNAHRFEDYS